MTAFCHWLAATTGSITLRESLLAYPIVESLHVLTLVVFVGLTFMVDLRLMGWALVRVPASELLDRLLPLIAIGFAIMIATGALLFYANPVRSFHHLFFRLKMLMLVAAGLNAWWFQATLRRHVSRWDVSLPPPRAAKIAGAMSLALWIGIITAGRMIAYDWFDCDTPQSSIVGWAAGCDALSE